MSAAYVLTWTPFALAVLVALRAMWRGLVEWQGKNGALTVFPTSSLAVIGAFGALAYMGMSIGGGILGGSQATGSSASPDASSLDWFCDWSYGTAADTSDILGTTSRGSGLGECFGGFTALTSDLFNINDVVVATGKGFPASMTNILKVNVEAGTVSGYSGSPMVQADSAWAAPSVGEYVFYRLYIRLEQSACSGCLNIHPFHLGTNKAAGNDYSGRFFASGGVDADSSYYISIDPNFQTGNTGLGQGRFLYPSDTGGDPSNAYVKTFQTLRYEIRQSVLANDSIQWAARVYNEAGTLVLQETDYSCTGSEAGGCWDGNGQVQWQSVLGEDKMSTVGSNGMAAYMGIEIGNNGITNDDGPSGSYMYFGGVAVRVSTSADNWIGAYPVGPEIG